MNKILIIEDELAYATLLADQLTNRSYEVVTASDGEEGLAKARKEKPDLILLDIRMPKMDGLTMLSDLRHSEQTKLTKVIMLTNLEPDETIVRKVIDDHLAYYFVKSDTKLEDLFKKIEEILAQ